MLTFVSPFVLLVCVDFAGGGGCLPGVALWALGARSHETAGDLGREPRRQGGGDPERRGRLVEEHVRHHPPWRPLLERMG